MDFHVTSHNLSFLRLVKSESADVVTCMFALNYFWSSEAEARTLIETVARILKPGGRFVGVCADAGKVLDLVDWLASTDMYDIKAEWDADGIKEFGSPYVLLIKDTVLDGNAPAPEYLVTWDSLSRLAAAHNLHSAKNGWHSYVDASKLPTPEMRHVSRINASFVFKKVESP